MTSSKHSLRRFAAVAVAVALAGGTDLAAPRRAAAADAPPSATGLSAPTPGAGPSVKIRRFAFLAGANDGGSGRARLRYANTDARAVSRVLIEMGGVSERDVVFAAEPDRAAFLGALAQMRATIGGTRVAGVRTELIFYYSGHSDEEGLLLRGERLPYSELRANIEQIPADVRVAVLDSCASGALTRGKGGTFRPPFMTDDSVKVKGHAFLTSSSATEVAQESDRIGASFFTHYLVSGLRGAADANHDRRVTFFEAYQFASAETLARTERTRGGAQHAAYDIQLNGTGDLVMTDVRATSAGLVLASELHGAISVREPGAALVAELHKGAGRPVELGLEPGRYLVTMTAAGASYETTVELKAGERTELALKDFQAAKPLELARARGDGAPVDGDEAGTDAPATAPGGTPPSVAATAAPVERPYRHAPVTLGFMPLPGSGTGEREIKNVALALIADRAAQINGLQLGIGANITDESLTGLQLTAGANIARGTMSGVQLSSAFNLVRGGEATGIQGTGGANVTFGPMRGGQVAGGANYANGSFRGLQLSGGFNVLRAESKGAQLTGATNWSSGDFAGLQVAGGVNVAAARFDGVQLGVVNYASEMHGLQLSVVNVAGKSSGLQLGLVNISDEDQGVPIGLVSYARKNGMFNVGLMANETTLGNLAVRVGGRRIYNLWTIGARPGKTGNRYAQTLAIGVRTPFESGPLSLLDVDVGAGSFTHDFQSDNGTLILSTARVIGGWRLGKRFTLLAGPTVNVLVRDDSHGADVAPSALEHVLSSGSTRVSIYPGFVAGFEI